MSSGSLPIDIAPSRSSYDSSACAFPAWPQRSSLDDPRESSGFTGRTSSYVSDDDLTWADLIDGDDTSSALSSGAASPVAAPNAPFPYAPQPTDAELLELARERAAMKREVVRFLIAEKERRRQQALNLRQKQRRGSASPKKGNNNSPKSKLSNMTSADSKSE